MIFQNTPMIFNFNCFIEMMKKYFFVIVAFSLLGCIDKNDTSVEFYKTENPIPTLTFENVFKEEHDSNISLSENSPIFKKYLRLAEDGCLFL